MKGNEQELNRHLEILELPPDATFSEIRKAYLQLKALYSSDSLAILPVKDDISDAQKEKILYQIEKAYYSLFRLFKNEANSNEITAESPPDDDRVTEMTADISSYTGPLLQSIRERLGIALHDIALSTKIQQRYLEKIEMESFDALPPAAYIRGMVVNYANFLSLDAKKVADDFMQRYHLWERDKAES